MCYCIVIIQKIELVDVVDVKCVNPEIRSDWLALRDNKCLECVIVV